VSILSVRATGRMSEKNKLLVDGHNIAEAPTLSVERSTYTRRQVAVAELSQLALFGTALLPLMSQTCKLVAETLDVEYSSVFEAQPNGWVLRAGVGWLPDEVGQVVIGPNHDSHASYTLSTKTTVFIENLKTEKRFSDVGLLYNHGIVSSISTVIPGKKQPYGVLDAHTPHRRKFTEDDAYFLQSMANILAAAVERERAEQAERDQRVLAEALQLTATVLSTTLDLDEVLNQILLCVAQVVPSETSNIALIENGVARVARARGYEATGMQEQIIKLEFAIAATPNMHYMHTTGQPLVIPDVSDYDGWLTVEVNRWIRSYAGAPIRMRDEVIGFISLDSAIVGAFTLDQAARLQTFADQAGLAIRNARLYEASLRHAAELAALYRAITSLIASDNITDVGYQIAQAVLLEFKNLDCTVLMLDENQHRLIRLARVGEYSTYTNTPLYIDGPGLVAQAIRSGQTIYIHDTQNEMHYIPDEPTTRSELVILLHTGQKLIGALDLQSNKPDAFSPQDRRILRAFARHAAIAIETAQLYEALRRDADELEMRVAERTAALFAANERVKAIFSNSSDALVVTRVDGVIEQVNPAFYDLFGYRDGRIIGRSLFMLVAPDQAESLAQLLSAVAEDSLSRRAEVKARRSNSALFHADAALFPVLERDGKRTTSVVCSMRDISDTKLVEAELRKALEKERELSELRSRFVATTSHEFRTPLATMLTASDLLKNYNDRMTDEQRTERIEKIQSEIHNMKRMLDDVLTISYAEEVGKHDFNPVVIDLAAFCREILDEVHFSIGAGHIFRFSESGDCTEASVDVKHLRQLITNLLSNAVKYSALGSTVYFEISCNQAVITLRITDEGIGVPDDDKGRLFDAFHRAKNVGHISGTGLGLAIAKQSVDLHGGTITFETAVGLGTTFTVTLPNNYD
jgi:PAS domain S-box-containing protein